MLNKGRRGSCRVKIYSRTQLLSGSEMKGILDNPPRTLSLSLAQIMSLYPFLYTSKPVPSLITLPLTRPPLLILLLIRFLLLEPHLSGFIIAETTSIYVTIPVLPFLVPVSFFMPLCFPSRYPLHSLYSHFYPMLPSSHHILLLNADLLPPSIPIHATGKHSELKHAIHHPRTPTHFICSS